MSPQPFVWATIHCCCGYACEVNAKAGTHNIVILRALETGNCELRIQSVVSEIMLDERGRARGVRYSNDQNQQLEQTADLVVISCAAIETARLLLISRSRLFPNGAGNCNGWLGHNLQDHLYTGAWELFKQDTYDDLEPGACRVICDFNHGTPGLIGGGMLANEFIRPENPQWPQITAIPRELHKRGKWRSIPPGFTTAAK